MMRFFVFDVAQIAQAGEQRFDPGFRRGGGGAAQITDPMDLICSLCTRRDWRCQCTSETYRELPPPHADPARSERLSYRLNLGRRRAEPDVSFGSKADMRGKIAMSALPPIADKLRDGRFVR